MNLKDAVVKRIKELLKQKGLKQYNLYLLSGVPQSTISSLFNKNTKTLQLDTLYSICSGLEIELMEFFNRDYFRKENLFD